MTRIPIDGFMRMPALANREDWFKFVDWKGDGRLDVEELAVVLAAVLPIDEAKA